MRVAFVTVGDTSRVTGGYIYDAEVIRNLKERGHDVQEVVVSGASYGDQARSSRELRLDAGEFDVVVVDALARVVCSGHVDGWMKTAPVVALVHELPGDADPENAECERPHEDALLAADVVVTVSEDGAKRLRERGVMQSRIRIVLPGFDALSVVPKSVRKTPNSSLNALCVAQWIERKDILCLVSAWRAARTSGAKLVLVGDTDADPGYARRVREELPGDGSVEVAGLVSETELARLYAGSDFFALPSRFEGYGIVYAEAMASGLPVIAREVGPLPELLGEAALFIAPEAGTDELASAIERLIEDHDLRESLAASATKRAATLPRWDETVGSFERALTDAVSGRVRERNRRSWNAVVGAHESHRVGLAEFLKGGGLTVFPEELSLLGEVSGKRLAHLMCNTGADTLSLAALGASVTGVDISDAAISRAVELSGESGIEAGFERSEVYGWLEAAAESGRCFDLALSTYGVVCWLDDLDRWARGIHGVLAPGGAFVLVEFHPASMVYDREWRLAADYPSGGRVTELAEGVGDYVGEARGGLSASGFTEGVAGFRNPEPARLHQWGTGEVVSALCGAGFRLERLEEYPFANGERHFARMREGRGRRMYPPDGVPEIPLMYGIRVVKD